MVGIFWLELSKMHTKIVRVVIIVLTPSVESEQLELGSILTHHLGIYF